MRPDKQAKFDRGECKCCSRPRVGKKAMCRLHLDWYRVTMSAKYHGRRARWHLTILEQHAATIGRLRAALDADS